VPALLGEGKLTKKYLLKNKTSSQAIISINTFMEKLDENMKEAGNLKADLDKAISSSSDTVTISREEYNQYMILKSKAANVGPNDGSSSSSSSGDQGTMYPQLSKKRPRKKE